jgi:hypothetical protein
MNVFHACFFHHAALHSFVFPLHCLPDIKKRNVDDRIMPAWFEQPTNSRRANKIYSKHVLVGISEKMTHHQKIIYIYVVNKSRRL